MFCGNFPVGFRGFVTREYYFLSIIKFIWSWRTYQRASHWARLLYRKLYFALYFLFL